MGLHDVCLSCDHKKHEHQNDSKCTSPYCPCLKFKATTLEKKV